MLSAQPSLKKNRRGKPLERKETIPVQIAREVVIDHCGLHPDDVLVFKPNSTFHLPAHFVALADNDRELIIAVRGTFSITDLLIDLTACQHDMGIGKWGPAHRGMLASAMEILTSICRIFDYNEESKSYAARLNNIERITIVGHSLGGGVATYLAILMKEFLRPANPKVESNWKMNYSEGKVHIFKQYFE